MDTLDTYHFSSMKGLEGPGLCAVTPIQGDPINKLVTIQGGHSMNPYYVVKVTEIAVGKLRDIWVIKLTESYTMQGS